MKRFKKILLTSAFLLSSASFAHAGCDLSGGNVSVVGNEFPAIQTVGAEAKACEGDGVAVKLNLTADHQKINVPGMSSTPPEYTSAIIANSSIVALINEDVIRSLDDLVAKHGQGIKKNQLITIDGKVMAVAFMANAQHLIYRADVLKEIGVEVPKSYEEVLAAAKLIREKGIMQYPLGGAYKAGWNLAQEFINMYIGHGGEFFKPGSAEPSINNAQGVAALNMMKELTDYMNPDFLTHDSNATAAEWEAGNVALMNFWGSRTGVLQDDQGAEEQIYSNTMVSGPLMVGDSGVPATTLWWDGFTVAKNASDEDAEATFVSMLHGIRPEILTDETMAQAVWMIEGYEPAPVAAGVFASIKSGAKPYPMLPYQGLLHTTLGDNIADFLQGNESAEKTLSDIEAAYTDAAKEKGFL